MENLLRVFNSLHWQDVVDIGLNSYILFRFYVLFRGTYVFRVLIGLTMLWFFQQIAAYLGLIVTGWVVQGIVAVAALIIVVVFRNEIRTVLQAKNLRSILWGFTAKTRAAPINVIADSAFELARRRHGGLIVIPGEEDLEELVQGGITWNGDVSREMILSIFFPDNPVHDGAALIEGDRITRVGVILPLSRRDDLPSHLGTRHRAALGITETCDAVVVVISEERGEVCLARAGRLRPIASRRKLVQKLEEHFGLAELQAPEQRKQNFEIVTAALVSVLFITGFWFSISRGLETLVTLDVPIEYMKRDPNMEIVNTSVNSVRLNLSGSGTLIKSMRPDQVRVRVDIGNAADGPNSFSITSSNISLPPGIILKEVTPQTVVVNLDVTVKKELPVQVDWTGKLPENALLAEATVEPARVEVVGGKRILETISTIYTEKVPLEKLKDATGTIEAGLVLQPASLKLASGSSDKVTIKYIIRRRE
jgi:uncharacterized protein (TIGR00159 family)